MQPGQVKGPVRSSQAFHIFKLVSKQAEVVKPFETVKAEVAASLKLEQAREMSRALAEESFNKLYEQATPDIKALALKAGLTVQTAGPYLASERPAVPAPEKLVPASFTFQPGQLGDLLETPDGYVIYKVTGRVPARLPELKEVQAQVEQDLRRVKAVTLARQEAERLAKLPLASLNALNPQTTGGFKRSSWTVPTLTGYAKVKDELDLLGQPRIYDKAGELVVVWLKGKQVADYAKLDAAGRQSLEQSLLAQKRQEAFRAFVQDARGRHKIVINKERI
ncbi:MAG: periplasmic folding chaperone [Deltaproteobacteria bacterium ADurb.Bin510]|nr:MAG: periplasmic folding chaperone [Deltaproteobacteria bacterium ADurb.Bin510]